MRTFDPNRLLGMTVGFDRLVNLMDTLSASETGNSYPPYNIERHDENSYRITIAVAGFGADELSINVHENTLTVRGEKADTQTDSSVEVLHRGIAARAFERRFQLADYVQVTEADLENGLLHIDLVREIPEAKKPRQIPIGAGQGAHALAAE